MSENWAKMSIFEQKMSVFEQKLGKSERKISAYDTNFLKSVS